MDREDLIERIVFMIFNCEVDLNDPFETMRQITTILNTEEKEN